MKFYQNKTLESYASRAAFPISLRQLIFFGKQTKVRNGVDKKEAAQKLIKGATFLQSELPIRLSHRLRDLQSLPFIVATQPSLELVYKLYQNAFEQIRNYPTVKSLEENERFCEFMTKLMDQHKVVIPQLAIALAEAPSTALPISTKDAFLTRMLRSRISRRVMTSQHLALSRQFRIENDNSIYVGVVNTRLRPERIVRKCAKILKLQEIDAEPIEKKQGSIIIKVVGDGEKEFPYVEEHLEYVIFELLKNSIRATRERHHQHAEKFPIIVTIVMGERIVSIRVSDQGGGIPRLSPEPSQFPMDPDQIDSTSSTVLTPMFSTAARREVFSFGHMHSRTNSALSKSEEDSLAKKWREMKLEGTVREQTEKEKAQGTLRDYYPRSKNCLGLGLTLSRVYAEYFGGSLKVYSMENFGSDAYLAIPRVGNTVENSE